MERITGRISRRTAALIGLIVLLASACATATGGLPGASAGAAAPLPAGTAGRVNDSGEAPAPGSGLKGGGQGDVGNPYAPIDQVRVIKNGTMTVEVKDLTVLVRARTAIVGLGGYVSGSQQSSGGDHQVASVTYRIPADRWDDALDALKALGTKLVSEQTQAVDVTGQVMDLGARVDNLRASERALQAIMARATKISEILEVQARLTDVRGQIEQLATQKAHLEEQAAFGTLTVTWDVPVVPVQQVSKGWDPGAEVERAFAQLVGFGQGLTTIVIWLAIVLLPILVVLGLGVGVSLLIARRLGLRVRQPDTVA